MTIRKWKQSRPYAWLTLIIYLIPVVVLMIGAAAIHLVEERTVASTGQSLALGADTIADMLDRVLFERYSDVLIGSQAGIFQGQDPTAMTTYLSALKKTYPLYLWLAVVDANGRIVAATDPASIGLDRSGREWFQEARDRRRVYVRDAQASEDSGGTLAVAFTAPVTTPQGEFLGAVTSRVSVPNMEAIFAKEVHDIQAQRGSQGTIEYQFLTRDGDVVADSLLRQEGQVNLKQLGLPSALFTGSAMPGYVEEMHLRRRVPVVTGYAQTRGHGEFTGLHWGILLRMDRRDILAPIRTALWKLSALGSIGIIPLLGFLLWTTRRLKKEMVQATEECARATRAEEILRESEEALRVTEERYRSLYENNPSMYFTVNSEGTVLSVNQFGAEQLGYSVEELVGQSVLKVVHADDRDLVRNHLATLLRSSPQMAHWEFRKIRKDGGMLWVKEIARAVRDLKGNPVVLIVCEDVTVSKRMEEALRESEGRYRALAHSVITAQEEERRRIARELHDETGQWLTAMLVGLRALEDAPTDTDVKSQVRELRRLASFTLGEVGRLARGLHPSVLDDLGLVAALERYAQEFDSAHGIKVSVLTRNLASTRLPLPVETALYRMAQEALTNAAKHASPKTIEIEIGYPGSIVTMTVKDDGCGFDVDEMLRSNAPTHHLGLHGMHERAALLNGSLVIKSQPLQGTTICARIPLTEMDHG